MDYWEAVRDALHRATYVHSGGEAVYVYYSQHSKRYHVVYERVICGWPMNTSNVVMMRVGS